MLLRNVLVLALISLPGIIFAAGQSNSPLQLVITDPSVLSESGTLQLTATLTNTSDHDVAVVQMRGDPTIAYRFTVRDIQHTRIMQRKADIVDETRPLARFTASSITLKPGQQVQETIELEKLYDLAQSNSYLIQAERYVPSQQVMPYMVSNQLKLDIRTDSSMPKKSNDPNSQPSYDLYIK